MHAVTHGTGRETIPTDLKTDFTKKVIYFDKAYYSIIIEK